MVIHEYFGVDEIVIWEIMQSDLPRFRGQLLEIIEAL
ncbi:MAG: HepT-like ribonuclease domain-containing protein [Bacteroidota bacterium]